MTRARNPELDGLRGFAIIGILLTHGTYWFSDNGLAGAVGRIMAAGTQTVNLFFVLSGFLIIDILVNTRSSVNRAQSFYARRALRMWPLYYVSLLIVFLCAPYFANLESFATLQTWSGRLSFLFYVQNWYMIAHKWMFSVSIIGHFWTLAMEEQFYLLSPLIVWYSPPKYLFRICLGISLAALILRIVLVLNFGPVFWIRNITPTRLDSLLLGGAISVYLNRTLSLTTRQVKWLAVAGLGILACAAVYSLHDLRIDSGPFMTTFGYTGSSLFCCALLGCCLVYVPFVSDLFRTSILQHLGKYSYGLYVFHVPINHWIGTKFHDLRANSNVLLALFMVFGQSLIAYALAWLSFRYFEAPFLRLKRFFEPAPKGAREVDRVPTLSSSQNVR